MKFLNPNYNTKKIRQYIADLIIACDYKNYNEVSHAHKCELASLLIEAIPGSEAECLIESNDLDSTIATLKKALAGTKEDDENFLYTIKKNIVRYFENTMEMFFVSVLENYYNERNEWLDHARKYGDADEAYERYREGL